MALRYEDVADIIRIIDASACEELVLETAELKLVVRRRGAGGSADAGQPAVALSPTSAAAPAPAGGFASPTPSPPATPRGQGLEVRAPMVGTFLLPELPFVGALLGSFVGGIAGSLVRRPSPRPLQSNFTRRSFCTQSSTKARTRLDISRPWA